MAIKYEDLLNLIANKVGGGATITSTRKYLEAFEAVIIEQMELNGEVYIHNFGWFEEIQLGGYDRMCGTFVEGESELIYQKPKKFIKFRMSEVLSRAINEDGYKVVHRRKKKYKNKREQLDAKNLVRRKPKPTKEDMMVGLLNKAIKKD